MKLFVADIKTKAGIFLSPYPTDMYEHLTDPQTRVWIDFLDPHYDWVKKNFRIPDDIISLVNNPLLYAYYEQHKQISFIKIPFCNPSQTSTATRSGTISFIIKENLLVSLHPTNIENFDLINAEADALARLLVKGTDVLCVYLITRLTVSYNRLLSNIHRIIEQTPHLPVNKRVDKLNTLHDTIHHLRHLLTLQKTTLCSLYTNPPAGLHIGSKKNLRRVIRMTDSALSEFSSLTTQSATLLTCCTVTESASTIQLRLKVIISLIGIVLAWICAETAINFLFHPRYRIKAILLCLLIAGILTTGLLSLLKKKNIKKFFM